MTDRERYLILLNGTVRARYALRHGATSEAHRELGSAVDMVMEGTSRARWLADCAEAEAVVEGHGG